MLRYFCDNCGKELNRNDRGRLSAKRGRVGIVITTALDGVSGAGHVCHDCVREIVASTAYRVPEPVVPEQPAPDVMELKVS